MTKERYQALMAPDSELSLTDEEVKEGYHFCWDWDGLLIHKDDPEAECCSCNLKQP